MEPASPVERAEKQPSLGFSSVLHETSLPGTATKLARVSYLFTIGGTAKMFYYVY